MAPISRPLEERFWEKVDKNGPIHQYRPELGRCWLWTHCHDEAGYGRIQEAGKGSKLLRSNCASYELHNGPIPAGLQILHNCDNPPCVNPAHLFLGTHQDNMDDKRKRGRQAKGEKNGWAKLTEEQVTEIRCTYVKGSQTHGTPALGRKYRVHHSTIWRVIREIYWK